MKLLMMMLHGHVEGLYLSHSVREYPRERPRLRVSSYLKG